VASKCFGCSYREPCAVASMQCRSCWHSCDY
jgi:hypothetical protein